MSLNTQRTSREEKNIAVFYDETLNYVYKKSERILSAIYLVTGLIKDEEPLKVSIRQSAIDLIKDTIKTDAERVSEKDNTARRIVIHLTEILSLLMVAESARLISAMNHAVIKREIVGLINLLADRYERGRDYLTIDSGYFGVPAVPISNDSFHSTTNIKSSIQNKGQYNQRVLNDSLSKAKLANPDQNENDDNAHASLRTKSVNVLNKSIHIESGRSDTIIAIIKDKGRVTIKDISSVITDISEKTIQRELTALVASGKLLKTGERRWSTYSVAQ